MFDITNFLVTGIVTLNVLYFLSLLTGKKCKRKMDPQTSALLTTVREIPANCQAMADALCKTPISDDERECAEQLRKILAEERLLYSSLETDPSLLLNVTKHLGETETNGALWTRYTVQYNLFAGSIVALGSKEQREKLYATQKTGDLGCFAFTECSAGVLSGACIETTAVYNEQKQCFQIHSPTPSSKKKWISQGLWAEHAVICANLLMTESGEVKKLGPHLFFARIQTRDDTSGDLACLKGVTIENMPQKTSLLGLDNAYIAFDNFEVPHSALLNKFSNVNEKTGAYSISLPKDIKRMLDLLICRLQTGRIVLSEFTIHHSLKLLRKSWQFASQRELWKGKKTVAPKMSELPLIQTAFIDFSRTCQIIAHFISFTREKMVECIKKDNFTNDVVEGACISKFVGTSFSVDVASNLRKIMGSHALHQQFWLGESSFVANATCAAEGDNTIMELKTVQDMIRKRTPLLPWSLFYRMVFYSQGRKVIFPYLYRILQAFWLGKAAVEEGQLLKEIAWCRAHLLIMDTWLTQQSDVEENNKVEWLESYESVLIRFPMPIQC